MGFFSNLVQQLRTIWSQTGKLARIGIAATAVLCVAAMVGVGIWSARPQYVPIASDLGPSAAAEIVSKLDAKQIPNRLNYSGSAVSVPQSQLSKARLVLGDLVDPDMAPVDDIGNSLISDPSLYRFKILRHMEASLAHTITRISGVEKATVHVSQPEPSPFVRDSKPTTASIVLELRRGSNFSREQAASIVVLVANAVEGLTPDQVTVVDTSGRLLSSTTSAAGDDIASQYEYKRQLEADLVARAEYMLINMLGLGKAVVRVAADVDFTRTSRESITYDPDLKVKKRETIKSTSTTDPQPVQGAGTSANLTPASGSATTKSLVLAKTEENDTEFETPKTVDTINEQVGTIKRLTVAAMVDLPKDQGAGGTGGTVGAEQVEEILKQAVGFDSQRGDEIKVLITPLAGIPAIDTPTSAPLDLAPYSDLIRAASLGLGALVALVLGFLILRRLRPVSVPADQADRFEATRSRQIAALSAQAMANPEAVARVIEAWLRQAGGGPAVIPAADRNPGTSPPGASTSARSERAA